MPQGQSASRSIEVTLGAAAGMAYFRGFELSGDILYPVFHTTSTGGATTCVVDVQLELQGYAHGPYTRYTEKLGGAPTVLGEGSENVTIVAPDEAWDSGGMKFGTYFLWIDTSGRLRIKATAPTSATDGAIVGVQA